MYDRFLRLFFFAVVFFVIPNGYCQKVEKLINQKTAGLLVEYGIPYYTLPEGQKYHILTIGSSFSFPLFQSQKSFNMSIDLFPHYGVVWLGAKRTDFEIGLNVRLGFNFSLSEKNALCLKLGSGPQYITVDTEKQANGFNFSDYYLATYKRRLSVVKQVFIVEIECGYRHISNAGLNQPNRSISSIIFGLGLSTAI